MSYPIALPPVGRLLSPLNYSSLYHLMATTANNAFDLHKKVLIVGCMKCQKVYFHVVYHLSEEIVLDGLQESSGLLMP